MKCLKLIVCLIATVAILGAATHAEAGKKHKQPPRSILEPLPTPTYGFGTPAPYPYGWFGVTYRSRSYDAKGFYGDYYQYGYWQGFR